MGERGKLLLNLALYRNARGDNWRTVELGRKCSESIASCSGNSGNEHESTLQLSPSEIPASDNNPFELSKFDIQHRNHESYVHVSSLKNIQPSSPNHELIDPIPSCSYNTGSNDPITSCSYNTGSNDKSDVNPSSSNTLNHDTIHDSSGSSSSSTISEDVTTGEYNYSPSESDSESSRASESQVPLSSLPNDTLIQVTEDATEVNKDKKSRKRKVDPLSWKKNVAKKLKDHGKANVSSTTNKPMNAKTMGPPCKNTCRIKCYLMIPNETREHIFQEYWDLGDANKQRDFISSCIVAIKPKYQYHIHENKRRDNNGSYFTLKESRIRVCKTFFKSTLDVTHRPIRTVVEKRSEVGTVKKDCRGRHKNHRKLDENIRAEMKRHINSISRIESHNTRSRSSREYIEGGKSLADLYRDYVEECKQKNLTYGKYLIYHQVFHNNFNVSFFTPKKDQCSLCVSYGNASDAQKEELMTEYENHIMEKDLSRLEKNKDKIRISNNYTIAVFDLQAVLPCPKGNVSLFYYKSKLNVLNFTIYEMTGNANLDECFCYVWDETHGNRGSNEIVSCLLSYIEQTSKNRPECDDLEFVFFSVNCAGQQKKFLCICMH